MTSQYRTIPKALAPDLNRAARRGALPARRPDLVGIDGVQTFTRLTRESAAARKRRNRIRNRRAGAARRIGRGR